MIVFVSFFLLCILYNYVQVQYCFMLYHVMVTKSRYSSVTTSQKGSALISKMCLWSVLQVGFKFLNE